MTVKNSVYESAVKGRAQFRSALKEERAKNEKQAARISELEAGLKSIKSLHSHGRSCVFVNDEWDCELNSVEAIAHSLLSPKDTQEGV